MIKRTWRTGFPPAPGWYEASVTRSEGIWRWYNGKWWSDYAYFKSSAESAAHHAKKIDTNPLIKWSDYYPENARVARGEFQ